MPRPSHGSAKEALTASHAKAAVSHLMLFDRKPQERLVLAQGSRRRGNEVEGETKPAIMPHKDSHTR